MSDDMVVVFAGPGDASEELVKAELDDFLPDDVEAVVVPSQIGRKQKGLKNVLAYLEDEFGEDGVERTDDLLKELTDAKNGVLVLLWGPDGDPETSELLEKALDAKIPCKDLTDGMDDITFKDEEAEPPAPEPEPEPQRRTRRTRSSASSGDAKPAEERTKPQADEKDEAPRRTRTRGKPRPADEPGGEAASDTGDITTKEPARIITEGVTPGIIIEPTPGMPKTVEELCAFVDARIAKHLYDLAKQISSGERKSPGRPRSDGSPAQPRGEETATYIELDDGKYRKRGKGRPRPGQKTVELTAAEVTKLTEEGKIEE
jgi:hypothetical protein